MRFSGRGRNPPTPRAGIRGVNVRRGGIIAARFYRHGRGVRKKKKKERKITKNFRFAADSPVSAGAMRIVTTALYYLLIVLYGRGVLPRERRQLRRKSRERKPFIRNFGRAPAARTGRIPTRLPPPFLSPSPPLPLTSPTFPAPHRQPRGDADAVTRCRGAAGCPRRFPTAETHRSRVPFTNFTGPIK